MIDSDGVKKIAQLSRLKLATDEEVSLSSDMKALLDYFKLLEELDTDGVKPLMTPTEIAKSVREDRVKKIINPDEALENAPENSGHLFKVPPVV